LQQAGVVVLVESDQPGIQLVKADLVIEDAGGKSIEAIVQTLGFAPPANEERS
jgi:hypothetical protein